LAELRANLTNRGVVDADEIYRSIQDHIAEALGDSPTKDDISATLHQLGDIDTIINDADVSVLHAKKARTGQRVALAAIVLSSLGLASLIFAPPVGIALALVGALVGLVHVVAGLPHRRLAIAGSALGCFTLLLAVVLASFLLSSHDDDEQRPETVIVEE